VKPSFVSQGLGLLEEAWALRQRDQQSCLSLTEQAEQLSTEPIVQGYVCRNKGYCAFVTGHFLEALEFMIKGREIALQLKDSVLQRDCVNFVGAASARLGDFKTAIHYVEETYRLNLLLQDEGGTIVSVMNIGIMNFELKQYETAIQSIEEALERSRAIRDASREATALTNLGTFRFTAYADPASLEIMREAYALCTELGMDMDAARNLANLGEALLELETPDTAITVLQQAREASLTANNAESAVSSLLYLGSAYLKKQEFETARLFLEQGITEALKIGQKVLEIDLEKRLCDLYIASKNYQQALIHHQRFYALEQNMRDENTSKAARALEVQHGLERARAEANRHKARNIELAEALIALEQSDAEKTKLLTQLRITTLELQQQVIRDSLTKLFNRHYLEERLTLEFQRASRTRTPLPVAMIDIDDFKQINDLFSHQTGDDVLRAIGVLMGHALRPSDVAARYGGEEFAIVLSGVTPERALLICERLRKSVEEYDWQSIAPNLTVTISLGLAWDTTVISHEKLLSLADAKMYQAKRSGKNRVCS
jgi:diguanylate cyclase (GGDEF)-like protein